MALPHTPEDFAPSFAAAWHARDGAALAALFTEDADFVNVTGIWWESRPAIARAHSYALTSFFAETRLAVGRVKRRDLGPDHVALHIRLRLSGQRAPDGSLGGARSTILFVVLERRAEGWIALTAQNTDIVPGAETQLAGEGRLTPTDYRDRG